MTSRLSVPSISLTALSAKSERVISEKSSKPSLVTTAPNFPIRSAWNFHQPENNVPPCIIAIRTAHQSAAVTKTKTALYADSYPKAHPSATIQVHKSKKYKISSITILVVSLTINPLPNFLKVNFQNWA